MRQKKANRQSVSLYPEHFRAVAKKARSMGIIDRRQYFSPAIQAIIEEWAELKGIDVQKLEKLEEAAA